MATIQAHYNHIAMLKRDVQAAWIKACEADGIEVSSKFVVFTNTIEAAAYNEMMGMYLKAVNAYRKQIERNRARQSRHAVMSDMGLKRVKGANGGTYYE